MEIIDARLLRKDEKQRIIQDKEKKVTREYAKLESMREAIEAAYAEAEKKIIEEPARMAKEITDSKPVHWCDDCRRYHKRHTQIDGRDVLVCYFCPNDRQTYLSYKRRATVSQHWIYDLHKPLQLKHIGPKKLLEYMMSIGLCDLREKYDGKDSIKFMSGYIKAAKNAKRDERLLYAMLESVFKCKQQVGIEYLLVDGKWRKGFMDLVCGSPNVVYILEVKVSAGYIDDEQLQKYHYSMCKILDKAADRRNVVTVPIAFDTSESSPTKYATFQEVMRLRTLSEISGYFVKRAAYITHRRL
jgi:hypothetical protein